MKSKTLSKSVKGIRLLPGNRGTTRLVVCERENGTRHINFRKRGIWQSLRLNPTEATQLAEALA